MSENIQNVIMATVSKAPCNMGKRFPSNTPHMHDHLEEYMKQEVELFSVFISFSQEISVNSSPSTHIYAFKIIWNDNKTTYKQ